MADQRRARARDREAVLRRALGIVVIATGCARFDLGQPIALLPASSWSDADVQTLASAAACWQAGFGVPFVVRPDTDDEQRVVIQFDDFACLGGRRGVYTPGDPGQIDICPPTDWTENYTYPLFTALLHELGHASGIRVEGTGFDSVMGSARQVNDALSYAYTAVPFEIAPPAFSPEDSRLLHDAVAVPGGACEDQLQLRLTGDGVACECAACAPDALEPNDTPTTATPLGGSLDDLTLCLRDIDNYRLTAAGSLSVLIDDGGASALTITADRQLVQPGTAVPVAIGSSLQISGKYVESFPVRYHITLR